MSEPAPGFMKHPNHSLTITPFDGVVVVKIGGEEIARTDRAKLLEEASYPVVYYIPIEDIPAGLLTSSEHQTYCPFKGAASYWDLSTRKGSKENALWSYRTPYEEAKLIEDHVAFYPDAATVIPLT